MNKISVIFAPQIDEEEKWIIKGALKEDIDFNKLEQNGIVGGAYDVQIIFDLLNNPYVVGFITTGICEIIKKIFKRNQKKIMDNHTRPRYTNIVLRLETKWIILSNANVENKITIRSSVNLNSKEEDYSEEKLAEYLKKEGCG